MWYIGPLFGNKRSDGKGSRSIGKRPDEEVSPMGTEDIASACGYDACETEVA